MKVVIQRVQHASCTIDGKCVSKINHGLCLLVGFGMDDTQQTISKVVKKILNLRIFEDENGKMNLSVQDVQGAILSISQFTLYANCKKGNRPSFIDAAKPDISIPLYDAFNEELRKYGLDVQTGVFGADMKIDLCNDGPVTICLDDKEI